MSKLIFGTYLVLSYRVNYWISTSYLWFLAEEMLTSWEWVASNAIQHYNNSRKTIELAWQKNILKSATKKEGISWKGISLSFKL